MLPKNPIIAFIPMYFFFEKLLQKKLGDCGGKKDISNKITIMKIIVKQVVYIEKKSDSRGWVTKGND